MLQSIEYKYKTKYFKKYNSIFMYMTLYTLYVYIMCTIIPLFDYRYKGCGIDEVRRKEMHVPKYIPNLVDMTGLENVESREQEKLLEMILMGKIPDETSIPALQDMERRNTGSLNRNFPFTYDPRRIHKILFVATATEPIPTKLIQSVRNVAQPDGSPSNYNPRCKR